MSLSGATASPPPAAGNGYAAWVVSRTPACGLDQAQPRPALCRGCLPLPLVGKPLATARQRWQLSRWHAMLAPVVSVGSLLFQQKCVQGGQDGVEGGALPVVPAEAAGSQGLPARMVDRGAAVGG